MAAAGVRFGGRRRKGKPDFLPLLFPLHSAYRQISFSLHPSRSLGHFLPEIFVSPELSVQKA